MSKILTIDYETSDSRVNFGQVLQAGIVISDDKLNIQSRHELRCRLKPTVIPSIGACLVHKIPVNILKNSKITHKCYKLLKTGCKTECVCIWCTHKCIAKKSEHSVIML